MQLTYNGQKKQRTFLGGVFTWLCVVGALYWWAATVLDHNFHPPRNFTEVNKQFTVGSQAFNITQRNFLLAYRVVVTDNATDLLQGYRVDQYVTGLYN